MKQTQNQYRAWLDYPALDPSLRQELVDCADNPADIADRFAQDLAFGTGGLRGVLGAGSNRMNIYTVARASRGVAAWLREQQAMPRCAIAYDSRHKSHAFAQIAAAVLADAGVQVFLFPELTPTPMLSFAVRHLGCTGGVVITASHNPVEYNGYKVYGADGGQILETAAADISRHIQCMPMLVEPPAFDPLFQSGDVRAVPPPTTQAYYRAVATLCTRQPDTRLRVVYSPLHGAGQKPVRTVLKALDYVDLHVVPEQEKPDGDFPTCPSPNPEEASAMRLAAAQARAQQADIFFATDPDADRIGAGVPTADGARLFTGNEIGLLLFDYLCRRARAQGTMPKHPLAVTTIVTTAMAAAVAAAHGVELREVLTGFKYIGQQIGALQAAGEEDRYLFGFEESCGYLAGTFVRDKDAVSTAALLCEMAAHYKAAGTALPDVLEQLYRKHGHHRERLCSFAFPGADGGARMRRILDRLRQSPPARIGALRVLDLRDYLSSTTGLPASNVLALTLEKGCRVTLRPSGTEPKLKLYLASSSGSQAESLRLLEQLEQACTQLLSE